MWHDGRTQNTEHMLQPLDFTLSTPEHKLKLKLREQEQLCFYKTKIEYLEFW